jgi:uncharacterized protein
VRVVVLTDTHVPKRARDLPAPLWEAIDDADAVIHAGDWVDARLLDALQARSRMLLACYGNNDGPDLRSRLPEIAYAEWAGVRVGVVHETGAAKGRAARMDRRFPDLDLLVFGHSHIPWDEVSPAGLRLLNPGSATDRRRQPDATYMTVELDEGRVRAVRLEVLPPRER